jgi:hypothetical protein
MMTVCVRWSSKTTLSFSVRQRDRLDLRLLETGVADIDLDSATSIFSFDSSKEKIVCCEANP